jgi:Flp pilus assembly pilin Flp
MNNQIQTARLVIQRLHRDDRGQDLVEYALIVAFAVGVVAVLTALYSTIKQVLTKANQALQSASQ